MTSSLLRISFALGACSAFAGTASGFKVVSAEFIEPAPAVPEVHASTIAETRSGALVAAWFGGSKEGNDDVAIWCSRREGGRWTAGQAVAAGADADGTALPAWNPVLHATADGRLLLFFKVGRSPNSWWGEVLESSDEGRTWTDRRRLPGGILGPIKNKPVRLSDGRLVCPSSIEHDAKHWAARFELTDESLGAWSASAEVADPAGFGAIQPAILVHRDGRLQALCRSNGRDLVQTWSRDSGRTWSPIESTGLLMANSGVDAVTLRDGSFLLVYNPSPAGASRRSWGERRPLVVAHSADGRSWQTVVTLETKPNRQGYAYPAIIQTRDGRIHITYTWNRARIKHVELARD